MISQEIVDYIRTQLEAGYTLEQITNALLKEGWTEDEIHEACETAKEVAAPRLEKPLEKPKALTSQPILGFLSSALAGVIILMQSLILIFYPSVILVVYSYIPIDTTGEIANTLNLFQIQDMFGVVVSILILLGSVLIYKNREVAGGIIVLVLSIISLLTVNGFLAGSLIGIAGGILALLKR